MASRYSRISLSDLKINKQTIMTKKKKEKEKETERKKEKKKKKRMMDVRASVLSREWRSGRVGLSLFPTSNTKVL